MRSAWMGLASSQAAGAGFYWIGRLYEFVPNDSLGLFLEAELNGFGIRLSSRGATGGVNFSAIKG
jgi:hypothetical protein